MNNNKHNNGYISLNPYYVPSTILSTLHVSAYLILTTQKSVCTIISIKINELDTHTIRILATKFNDKVNHKKYIK